MHIYLIHYYIDFNSSIISYMYFCCTSYIVHLCETPFVISIYIYTVVQELRTNYIPSKRKGILK
ncbi:hypothetical protein PFUGPA_02821 [Plasmodium falciparum Palo Alto/Uganda]|uniref:Uncharacterized protein n=1 Tax=Plasmodium falciparum (isolate Palo Alto / Uganda) TaxID=57270 RepID=W4IYA0_PLAFP|nr:hypothetical protein PFUGPA_02821 [Plasmodium falciparum Palo Alto/Uganda]